MKLRPFLFFLEEKMADLSEIHRDHERNKAETNHSSDQFNEKSSHDSTKQLCNPIQDAGEYGDLSPKSQPKGDRRVDMSTGDVSGDRHSYEEGKPMADSHRD